MTVVGLRPQGSQAVLPGSSICGAKYFYDSTDFFRNSFPIVPKSQLVGQQGSEAIGPGSNLCRAKCFHNFTDFFRNSNGSHGTVGRKTGFESGRYGFESQPSATFFNLIIITTENRDTTLLCMKIFDTRIFLKQGRVPPRSVSVFWDKKFPTENRDIPLLCIEFFGTVKQKFFDRKS